MNPSFEKRGQAVRPGPPHQGPREAQLRDPARVSLVLPRGASWRDVGDTELVMCVRRGDEDAKSELFDRYANRMERLVFSLLGPEPEAEDVLHEVFVRAFERIDDIDDPSRLRGWLTGITVLTAREWIRRRVRRRWLSFVSDVPEVESHGPDAEVNEATRCTFTVLAELDPDERFVFSLRFLEGLELSDIALACDVSISTAKRRLKDAEKHFVARARRMPALASWIDEGRWARK